MTELPRTAEEWEVLFPTLPAPARTWGCDGSGDLTPSIGALELEAK